MQKHWISVARVVLSTREKMPNSPRRSEWPKRDLGETHVLQLFHSHLAGEGAAALEVHVLWGDQRTIGELAAAVGRVEDRREQASAFFTFGLADLEEVEDVLNRLQWCGRLPARRCRMVAMLKEEMPR